MAPPAAYVSLDRNHSAPAAVVAATAAVAATKTATTAAEDDDQDQDDPQAASAAPAAAAVIAAPHTEVPPKRKFEVRWFPAPPGFNPSYAEVFKGFSRLRHFPHCAHAPVDGCSKLVELFLIICHDPLRSMFMEIPGDLGQTEPRLGELKH